MQDARSGNSALKFGPRRAMATVGGAGCSSSPAALAVGSWLTAVNCSKDCSTATKSKLLATDFCIRSMVHPGLHNKNLLTVLNGGEIRLAPRHTKIRRAGYRQ